MSKNNKPKTTPVKAKEAKSVNKKKTAIIISAAAVILIACILLGIFVVKPAVDNNKESNFSKSNEILANLIYSLISDVSTSIDGIYDYSEICAMLEQKGYGILNYFTRKPTQVDITSSIKAAITNSIFADIEQRNTLYYCGIKSSTMRKTVKIDYEELQLSFGYWRDVFQGYQTKTDMIFLSGLQYPMTVINRLYEAIREDKKKIEMDLQLNTEFVFKDDYAIQVKNPTTNSGLSAREKLMKLIR